MHTITRENKSRDIKDTLDTSDSMEEGTTYKYNDETGNTDKIDTNFNEDTGNTEITTTRTNEAGDVIEIQKSIIELMMERLRLIGRGTMKKKVLL